MKVVIIDYGAGNVQSVANALLATQVQCEIIVSKELSDVQNASHLILPGVGAFGDCMSGLKDASGLIEELKTQVLVNKKPFLGVCVGMQVMATIGYENGEHQGLNLIAGKVEKISQNLGLKIPHMGWNEVTWQKPHPIFAGIESGEHFYFANSYHFICQDQQDQLAQVNYGLELTAAIARDNIVATQFHPEKSGKAGLKLLQNFLNWRL